MVNILFGLIKNILIVVFYLGGRHPYLIEWCTSLTKLVKENFDFFFLEYWTYVTNG